MKKNSNWKYKTNLQGSIYSGSVMDHYVVLANVQSKPLG